MLLIHEGSVRNMKNMYIYTHIHYTHTTHVAVSRKKNEILRKGGS